MALSILSSASLRLCFQPISCSAFYIVTHPNPNLNPNPKQLPFNLLRIVLKAIAMQRQKKSFAKLLFIISQHNSLRCWGKYKFFCLHAELFRQFKKLIFGGEEEKTETRGGQSLGNDLKKNCSV